MNTSDQSAASNNCIKCGEPLLDDTEGNICLQCQFSNVEKNIPDAKPKQLDKNNSSSFNFTYYGQLIVLIILIIGVIYLFFNAHDAFRETQPIRKGSYQTDVATDQCIDNLWTISSLLQSKKAIPDTLYCPVSKKPYIVIKGKEYTSVQCPNPEKHKCKSLYVNNKIYVPVLQLLKDK